MKLPHREHAYIPREKITGYLLNPEHPKGRGKAKFFTPIGRRPKVRVVWFIEMSGTQPRLVTAYPIEVNDD